MKSSNDLYFKLTGSLLADFFAWKETVWAAHVQERREFSDEIGTSLFLCQRGFWGEMTLHGFQNSGKEIPGTRQHKEHADVLVPDLRTKAGKLLKDRMVSLKEPVPFEIYNKACPGSPWCIERDGRSFISGIGALVRKDSVFIHFSSLAETTIHPELEKIEKWEFEKALFEASQEVAIAS